LRSGLNTRSTWRNTIARRYFRPVLRACPRRYQSGRSAPQFHRARAYRDWLAAVRAASASLKKLCKGCHRAPHFVVQNVSLTIHHLAVLRDRNADAGTTCGVDQFDRLGHRIGIFPAVFHGFEAQTSPDHVGSCGRFSGVSSANLWVSFMPCLASACGDPNAGPCECD
jgi:hypothetical protein